MKKSINTYKDLLSESELGTETVQIDKELADWLIHNVDCDYVNNKELVVYGLKLRIEVI